MILSQVQTQIKTSGHMNLHKNNEKKRKTSADKRNPKFIADNQSK